MDTKTRIIKAIAFFRAFSDKSDSDIYRKSVLKFCDLVEDYISGGQQKLDTYEQAKKIFNA